MLKQILNSEKKKKENRMIIYFISIIFVFVFAWIGYKEIKNILKKEQTGSAIVYPESFRNIRKFFRQFEEPKIGDKAALFKLKDVNGQVYDLKKDLNKPTLFIFQHTRCPNCTVMEKDLNKIILDYEKEINFVTIGIKEDKQNIIDYKKEKDINRHWLIDQDYTVSLAYRVGKVPKIFLITKDRKIKFIANGVEDFDVLRKILGDLVK